MTKLFRRKNYRGNALHIDKPSFSPLCCHSSCHSSCQSWALSSALSLYRRRPRDLGPSSSNEINGGVGILFLFYQGLMEGRKEGVKLRSGVMKYVGHRDAARSWKLCGSCYQVWPDRRTDGTREEIIKILNSNDNEVSEITYCQGHNWIDILRVKIVSESVGESEVSGDF